MSYFAQIKIVDQDGNDILVGESGELLVRIEKLDDVLRELKKINIHLSAASNMEPSDEDAGG